jgi:hypothetical protein
MVRGTFSREMRGGATRDLRRLNSANRSMKTRRLDLFTTLHTSPTLLAVLCASLAAMAVYGQTNYVWTNQNGGIITVPASLISP